MMRIEITIKQGFLVSTVPHKELIRNIVADAAASLNNKLGEQDNHAMFLGSTCIDAEEVILTSKEVNSTGEAL